MTTKRSMGELFRVLSTAPDSPAYTNAQTPSKSRAMGGPHGPGKWKDVLDPGQDPDVVEGQYYSTVVLLSIESTSITTTMEGISVDPQSPSRRRPLSPLSVLEF